MASSSPVLFGLETTPRRSNASLTSFSLPIQCKPGVDAAPSALIASGLLTQLRDELGYRLHGDEEVHLYTDLVPAQGQDPPYRGMKNPKAVSAVTRRIAEQTYHHASEGRLVLTLGGDHSIVRILWPMGKERKGLDFWSTGQEGEGVDRRHMRKDDRKRDVPQKS